MTAGGNILKYFPENQLTTFNAGFEHFIMFRMCLLLLVSVVLVARRTNNRKVVGSMPANVVCITVDR